MRVECRESGVSNATAHLFPHFSHTLLTHGKKHFPLAGKRSKTVSYFSLHIIFTSSQKLSLKPIHLTVPEFSTSRHAGGGPVVDSTITLFFST